MQKADWLYQKQLTAQSVSAGIRSTNSNESKLNHLTV